MCGMRKSGVQASSRLHTTNKTKWGSKMKQVASCFCHFTQRNHHLVVFSIRYTSCLTVVLILNQSSQNYGFDYYFLIIVSLTLWLPFTGVFCILNPMIMIDTETKLRKWVQSIGVLADTGTMYIEYETEEMTKKSLRRWRRIMMLLHWWRLLRSWATKPPRLGVVIAWFQETWDS